MKSAQTIKSLACALVASCALVAGSGCKRNTPQAPTPVLASATPLERANSLRALEDEWRKTVKVDESPTAMRNQRRFLTRLAYYVMKTEGTESYQAAQRLWNLCVKDHMRRFPESDV